MKNFLKLEYEKQDILSFIQLNEDQWAKVSNVGFKRDLKCYNFKLIVLGNSQGTRQHSKTYVTRRSSKKFL